MKNKKLSISIIIVVVCSLIGGYYIYDRRSPDPVVSKDETTSTAPSAQSDFSDGGEREPGNTIREDEGSATVEDRNGEISNKTNSSSWTTSKSGEITAYTPARNSVLKSGDELSGKSNLPYVSFRIIDSVSGVIATGRLKVTNGQFSGIMNYNTGADEGRLDLYGVRDGGVEYGNIEIPVKFK